MFPVLAAAVLFAPVQGRPVFRELIAKPGRWVQSRVTLKSLHGKIVVLDFWDYTCVNCIRTLPYLKEWYRRYHADGLEIIGIHTPEYAFENDNAKVLAAAKRYGIPWPILGDPQRENWWEYGVYGWPTTYLLDENGHAVQRDVGEGYYDWFEGQIQIQLRRIHPGIKLPPVMSPVRSTDKPGAVCRPVTPEIYTWIKGLPKNQLGYKPADIGKLETFSYPSVLPDSVVFISGAWSPQKHFLQAIGEGSNLKLRYFAKEVYAVFAPLQPVKIQVFQDGKPAAKGDLGDDVKIVNGIPTLTASESRMYSILKNHVWSHRNLELRVKGPGLEIYEFTFSTDCMPTKKKGAT